MDAGNSYTNCYCKPCRRILNKEAHERKKKPRICHCGKELREQSQSRKGYCSILCEIEKSIKINKNGCWEWINHCLNTGYGYITINKKKLLAHRVVYEIYHGSIDDEKVIRHQCFNEKCVNPQHMKLGSQAENIHDSIRKKNIKTKLTWDQVKEMRARYQAGERPYILHKEYPVHYKTFLDIVRYKKWKKNPEEYL